MTYYVAVSAGGADPAWRTATGGFSLSLTNEGAPDSQPSTTSFTGAQLVALAKSHLGEAYIDDLPALGKANYNNPNYQGPWDCSEFASWCVYQASGGTLKIGVDSAWNAFSGTWEKDALAGKLVSVDLNTAIDTAGAIFLRFPTYDASGNVTKAGHVAISEGNGKVVNALFV